VYGAAALAAEATALEPLVLEAGAAKAQATEAFFFCAQEAIQLHGGVGFTWEYDPHLYFKRAQAGAHWLGTPQQWRERIAAALLD
jgi:alkylation response protein AidB-like acyl-CoA dehydrogenase